MTTNVKIQACCADDTQVEIRLIAESELKNDLIILQNGESHELHVYEDRKVTVNEVKK